MKLSFEGFIKATVVALLQGASAEGIVHLAGIGGIASARQSTANQDKVSIKFYARVMPGMAIFVRHWFRD